jgi:hypothetical protein
VLTGYAVGGHVVRAFCVACGTLERVDIHRWRGPLELVARPAQLAESRGEHRTEQPVQAASKSRPHERLGRAATKQTDKSKKAHAREHERVGERGVVPPVPSSTILASIDRSHSFLCLSFHVHVHVVLLVSTVASIADSQSADSGSIPGRGATSSNNTSVLFLLALTSE